MEDKKRLTQLEEQLSNTLKAVDKLHADVEAFKDYAIENNKVVNSMLRKLDDHAEQFEKMNIRMEGMMSKLDDHGEQFDKVNVKLEGILEEIVADRKLRDAQFDLIMRKFEYLESKKN